MTKYWKEVTCSIFHDFMPVSMYCRWCSLWTICELLSDITVFLKEEARFDQQRNNSLFSTKGCGWANKLSSGIYSCLLSKCHVLHSAQPPRPTLSQCDIAYETDRLIYIYIYIYICQC